VSTSIVHLVARANSPRIPLPLHEVASALWPRLKRSFPEALGAVLMPDHLHLVTETSDPSRSRDVLAHVVGNFSRSCARWGLDSWQRVPAAEVIVDHQKLIRVVRYVALNPVRAGLIADPLLWPWSTLRDVMGAVIDPWVDSDRLARVLNRDPRTFAAWWHRYVSTDTTATAFQTIVPCSADRLARVPLEWIADAAASATRRTPADIRRSCVTRWLFLTIGASSGWDWSSRLADACAITPRAVLYNLARRNEAALNVGLRCLADPRLRVPSRTTISFPDALGPWPSIESLRDASPLTVRRVRSQFER
jgi:hypothetical protein